MTRTWLVVAALAGAIGVSASRGARADDAAPYVVPDFLATTPALPVSMDAGHALRLDLAEALRVAVKQNLDLALERKAVAVAELGVAQAEGAFEPTVSANASHASVDRPPSSAQEGSASDLFRDRADTASLSIGDRFTTGTSVDLTWTNGRDKSTLGTAVAPLNYRTFLALRVTQPVARGFSPDLAIPKADILRAHIASERERAQLALAMADLVERTELAYWDVLQALFRYDLALRTTKLAEDQLALTQRQIEAGTTPPSDVISAQASLAQHKLELLQAEQQIAATSDQLRAVMHLPREDWARPIVPTEIPAFTPAPVTSVDAAFEAAVKARPELAQLALDVESARLAIRTADNARLPQLDLGLEGDLTGQGAAYGDALSQLGGLDARGWSVFLNFTWTPLQRATRAAAAIARVRQEVTTAQREQLVQRVWLEVRDAQRTQASADRQLRAAAQFRDLAEQALALEQRKFLAGNSQNLFVAQRQEALASARLAELSALLAHRRATTSLVKATGGLLAARKIRLD